MIGIWAKGLQDQMNITLAFRLNLPSKKQFNLKLTAADCYKIYLDGKFFAFGPQRAAHGYARVANYTARAKNVVIEVHSHQINSYCWIEQPAFFACEIQTDDKNYTSSDFSCYRLTDRVQRVQRYSFQRCFTEIYKMSEDRSLFYLGEESFEKLQTVNVDLPILLQSYVDEPKYNLHFPKNLVESGAVVINEDLPIWQSRAHNLVGTGYRGFLKSEWEEFLTDETSKFEYLPNQTGGKFEYKTYDFGRAITGFCELKVKAKNKGVIYVIFDEILWKEAGKGENHVAFERNSCSSVHKFIFEKSGEYSVCTFEPYLMRYALVVSDSGIESEISLRDYENPNADNYIFNSNDEEVNKLVDAIKATFAQNATDILMDCPSRERAGWLSDSYFSSEAEYILTGKNQAEKAFLENYAYADSKGLPEGVVPMCYPADTQTFIPNWTMWYILELEKYAKRWPNDDLVEKSKAKVDGLLGYFEKKENEFGLLENLEGWIFVEWSSANKKEHVEGVNVPSNILYASALDAVANLYGYKHLNQKANKIREYIKKYAYDGKFFVDNLTRDENGNLKQTGLLTEVCQYYAFWFNCITKEEYPWLYEELMQRLGVNRKPGYMPEIGTSNVMYGLYMRIDLLMREGKKKEVLEECKKLFMPMVERTGTLWEHNGISASCNHGFASYALKWILFAMNK